MGLVIPYIFLLSPHKYLNLTCFGRLKSPRRTEARHKQSLLCVWLGSRQTCRVHFLWGTKNRLPRHAPDFEIRIRIHLIGRLTPQPFRNRYSGWGWFGMDFPLTTIAFRSAWSYSVRGWILKMDLSGWLSVEMRTGSTCNNHRLSEELVFFIGSCVIYLLTTADTHTRECENFVQHRGNRGCDA